MKENTGKRLIKELLYTPSVFSDKGKGYDLLQEYFNGYSVNSLIPLLNSDNEVIQREAVWIVSELGESVCSLLLDEVLPLLTRSSLTKYFAMQCVLLGTLKAKHDSFIHLINELESTDEATLVLAMDLTHRATNIQLRSVKNFVKDTHKIGVDLLLKSVTLAEFKGVELLQSTDKLLQRYGAIIAAKTPKNISSLIKEVTYLQPAVSKFLQQVIETDNININSTVQKLLNN